jgi:L-iditol 2-dehydrogenase
MESIVLQRKEGRTEAILSNIKIPKIDGKHILVRVKCAGICGTDLKLYTGQYPVDDKVLPIVLGHEFVGEVIKIGAKVTKVAIGDRVVATPSYTGCGKCMFCDRGEIKLCKTRRRMGFNCDGVFSEFVRLHEEQIFHIPDSISDDAGAMIEPLSVAVSGVYKANIKPTDTILVTGPGAIGLLTSLVAKRFGAKVILSGIDADKSRLEIAKQMGVDMTVFSRELPSILQSEKIIIDIVLECSGNVHAVNLGIDALRPNGQFVQIGTTKKAVSVNFMDIAYKELIVTGSIGALKEDWVAAIKLMEQIQTKALLIVKKHLPFKDFHKGFEECLNNGGPKILLTPTNTIDK